VGLRHRVKVEHRLLNLRDCDSVLSERCRQTNSQDFFKNNNNMGLLFLQQVKTGMAYAESSLAGHRLCTSLLDVLTNMVN